MPCCMEVEHFLDDITFLSSRNCAFVLLGPRRIFFSALAFCPSCGKEVPPDSTFCPSCGFALKSKSSSAQSALGAMDAKLGRHQRLGYNLLLLGCALTFILAIFYLTIGNGVAGGLGIVFSIVGIIFGRGADRTAGRTVSDFVPLFIGLIIMALSTGLGILVSVGKPGAGKSLAETLRGGS